MADEALEDFGKRAAGFAGGDEVHVEGGEDAGEIAERLGEAAAIHEGAVEALGEAVEFGVFEAFFEDAEGFVEGHPGGEEVGELLGEKVLVGEGEGGDRAGREDGGRGFLGGRRGFFSGSRGVRFCRGVVRGGEGFDFDGDAALLLDLEDGRRAVRARQHAVDEFPIGLAGEVFELGHAGRATAGRGFSRLRNAEDSG